MKTSTRESLIAAARSDACLMRLKESLSRRVAIASESQNPERRAELFRYLDEEIAPSVAGIGFTSTVHDNPVDGAPPFLIASRIETGATRSLLMYAHGDVVSGQEGQWQDGAAPFLLTESDGRWYGRGSADNKGQHSINLVALEEVLRARGKLGFNVKLLFEMGEETGSPGLAEFCQIQREALGADVFLASDGPRLNAASPTIFLGSRGVANFELAIALRHGAHHSGNWGGLLKNPGTRLAHAITALVDGRGRILVPELANPPLAAAVAKALAAIEPGEPLGPEISPDWGDPDRSAAERVFASNALEVLAFETGNPRKPVNAIPGSARATMQLRFVVGIDPSAIVPAVRRRLDALGFNDVTVTVTREEAMPATRIDPDHAFVREVVASMTKTARQAPAVLPNLGGSLPNHCFSGILGLPTVWMPHSYPGCNQHAPNEHMLVDVAREGMALMAGVLFDLGGLEQ